MKEILVSFVFFLTGIFCIYKASNTTDLIMGWFVLIFFGACFILSILAKTGFFKVVFVDEKGIKIKKDIIPWNIISGIRKSSINGAEIWLIDTNNYEEEIEKATGLRRTVLEFNVNKTGAIYSLSPDNWQGDFEDFCNECKKWKTDLDCNPAE